MKCQARQMSDQMRCEACRLTWDMNDPEPPKCGEGGNKPPAYARVNCLRRPEDSEDMARCGAVDLTEAQYERQLSMSNRTWRCPVCMSEAWFDDEYFERRHIGPELVIDNEPQFPASVGKTEVSVDVEAVCVPAERLSTSEQLSGHVFYNDGDDDAPSSVLDSAGQVTLALCRVCGQGEGDLEVICPGPPERDTRSDKGRGIVAKIAETLDVPVLATPALRCNGVGRAPGYDTDPQAARVLEVYLNREPTDAEIRHVHDLLRHNMPQKPR